MKRRLSIFLVATSGAVTLVVALVGCAHLLFPCGNMYGCAMTEVTSLPPRNDPLSVALTTPVRQDDVEDRLTRVVRAQYASLGHRWPSEPQCESVASTGCRYRIAMKFVLVNSCYEMTLVVAAGTLFGPVVQVSSQRPLQRSECG